MELNNKMNKEDIDFVNESVSADKEISLQMKQPKRIIHFSDGTLEEYSDDDNDEDEIDGSVVTTDDGSSLNHSINEKNLTWIPWIKFKSYKTGKTALAGIDYVGSALAGFLGITTPKFALEYEAFKRNEDEKAEIEKEKMENASWQENTKNIEPNEVITNDVKSSTNNRF